MKLFEEIFLHPVSFNFTPKAVQPHLMALTRVACIIDGTREEVIFGRCRPYLSRTEYPVTLLLEQLHLKVVGLRLLWNAKVIRLQL